MRNLCLCLAVALIAVALTGCGAMKQGLENLNTMAAEQAAIKQQEQKASWESDIAKGHYSGTVKVALIPVLPSNEAKSGINQEKAIAILRDNFAEHQQFELLDDQKTEHLKRDLRLGSSSLDASRVNAKASQRSSFGGVDADVVLRSGLKTETFTGINKKTGKIGQGVKIICWTEYMVIGVDRVIKGSFEETNIFKNEAAVAEAAQSFHETILNELMIEHLQAQVAQAELAEL